MWRIEIKILLKKSVFFLNRLRRKVDYYFFVIERIIVFQVSILANNQGLTILEINFLYFKISSILTKSTIPRQTSPQNLKTKNNVFSTIFSDSIFK